MCIRDRRYAKWRYDDLPIVPESWMFEVTKDKAQQFKVLSALMKDKRVTELVCATDAGREGELIFRLDVYKRQLEGAEHLAQPAELHHQFQCR